MSVPQRFRIKQIIQETELTKSFVLEPLSNGAFQYRGGQFLSVIFSHSVHAFRRAYSFSSAPQDEFPKITVKYVTNGAGSRWMLDHWKTGDVVEAIGPAGKFVLPLISEPADFVFTAAGSGIVPVMSMIKEALVKFPETHLHLLYSNRSQAACIFREELQALEIKHPDTLHITWFFSDSKYIQQARINAGFLERYLQTALRHPISQTHVYSCGPDTFMYLTEVVARSNGIQPKHLHQEVYFRETENVKAKTFDATIRQVTIRYQKNEFHLEIPSNQSILAYAKSRKIELPWSCEAGRCSSCMAKCSNGIVVMTRNEVLTDQEVSDGWILTCTGHATSDQVIIDIPTHH